MDKSVFLSILESLISNFSENRRGLPDLIVFNNYGLFFSEVKSEKDRVSEKQMEWHKFLSEKMKLRVEIFLINHTERKINNLKSKYSLYENFNPKGDLNDFKNDLAVIQNFVTDLNKLVNISFKINKDGNEESKINSKIQEIQNEIKQRKIELAGKPSSPLSF